MEKGTLWHCAAGFSGSFDMDFPEGLLSPYLGMKNHSYIHGLV